MARRRRKFGPFSEKPFYFPQNLNWQRAYRSNLAVNGIGALLWAWPTSQTSLKDAMSELVS